jgi:hypothetical protein
MKKKYHLKKVNNYGIGGTRFAYQSKPSENPRYDLYFCGRAQKMDRNCDIVVVYGGVNDQYGGHFRALYDLYEKNELTSAIRRSGSILKNWS